MILPIILMMVMQVKPIHICGLMPDGASTSKCEPMVVPANVTHHDSVGIPPPPTSAGLVVFLTDSSCITDCPKYVPAYDSYSCTDKRRVLLSTEDGKHICVLFPQVKK